MPRVLTENESKAVDEFTQKMGIRITPHQPSFQELEYLQFEVTQINNLLKALIPLSNNDHLLRYTEDLASYDNQDQLCCWLDAIQDLVPQMIDSESDSERLYRNLFRAANNLAVQTNLNFAATAFSALKMSCLLLTRQGLIDRCKALPEYYRTKRQSHSYYEDIYFNEEELSIFLKSKFPPPILWVSSSQPIYDDPTLGPSRNPQPKEKRALLSKRK